jgi:hypothetical protein
MPLIKNSTKKLKKKSNSNSKTSAKTTKTHFHKFFMNLTTKNTKKYRHPYKLYLWTPWKVSTFLAWEEEDYSLKTLEPLSKASDQTQQCCSWVTITRSSKLLVVVDWGRWMAEIVQKKKKKTKKIEGKEKGLKKRKERN